MNITYCKVPHTIKLPDKRYVYLCKYMYYIQSKDKVTHFIYDTKDGKVLTCVQSLKPKEYTVEGYINI